MARPTSSDGYVTLAVLVMAGLLATLAATLLTLSRPALDLARIGADRTVVEALVDGGMNAAGYLLFAGQQDPGEVDGLELAFGEGEAVLAVQDESARVDLNSSDQELLAGLFEEVEGNSLSPEAFAARVLDWRDEDEDITDGGGAESGDYATEGSSHTPRNAPFRTVAEVRNLLGLSPRDYGRLAPYLTVYNATGTIDPLSAPPIVLRSIPDITREEVTKIVKARETGMRDREALAAMVMSRPEYLGLEPSGVYRVGVRAELSTGLRDAAEAVMVAPQEDGGSDYGVLVWSRPDVTGQR